MAVAVALAARPPPARTYSRYARGEGELAAAAVVVEALRASGQARAVGDDELGAHVTALAVAALAGPGLQRWLWPLLAGAVAPYSRAS